MKVKMLNIIETTQEELQELFNWKDKNKDLVRKMATPPVHEGVITLGGYTSMYFKRYGDIVHFKYYALDKLSIRFDYHINTWEAKARWHDEDFVKSFAKDIGQHSTSEVLDGLTKDIITTYATMMAYLNEDVYSIKNK